MIKKLLAKDVGKTLKFKEKSRSLAKIVQTAVAFIERHTMEGFEIERVRRKELPQYPPSTR